MKVCDDRGKENVALLIKEVKKDNAVQLPIKE